jgi:Fe-S oxidoreductase
VKDVTTVLHNALAEGRLRFRPTTAGAPAYAYHDPCHAARLARVHAAPRALLGAALGVAHARQLFRREGRAHPCGAVVGLVFTHPAIAAQLAEARLADATTAGAEWLITDDARCLHHLRMHASGAVQVRGFYETLAERLRE